jgi:subtilisin-like proprotein convertase family protein
MGGRLLVAGAMLRAGRRAASSISITSWRCISPSALVVTAAAAFAAPGALAAQGASPARTFTNSDGIAINDGACDLQAQASPYPSTIAVSGFVGTAVQDVNVTLTGFTHQYPQDVRALLVGPQGQTTLLLHENGEEWYAENLTLTFDDGAWQSPTHLGTLTTGTYKPVNQDEPPYTPPWACTPPATSFPGAAPTGPYGSTLGGFNGTDPNGVWKLYVVDNGQSHPGSFAGWSLEITAAQPDTTAPSTRVAVDPASPDGRAGWYVSSPHVTVSAVDEEGGSGVDEIRCVLDPPSAPAGFADMPAGCDYAGAGAAVTSDGEHVLYAASRDNAGNTPGGRVKRSFMIDTTAPSVGYTGNQAGYEVDATVEIACTATDGGSGIDSVATSCASIQLPAYQFAVGTNTLQASAVDLAGNTASASTSFDVRVSVEGLCRLTTRFVQGSARYAALTPTQRAAVDRLADGLCRGLAALAPGLTPIQKAAVIRAYQTGVTALVAPGWLTTDQATTLRGLADRL